MYYRRGLPRRVGGCCLLVPVSASVAHLCCQFTGSVSVFDLPLHHYQVLQNVTDSLRRVDCAVLPLLQKFADFICAHLLNTFCWQPINHLPLMRRCSSGLRSGGWSSTIDEPVTHPPPYTTSQQSIISIPHMILQNMV